MVKPSENVSGCSGTNNSADSGAGGAVIDVACTGKVKDIKINKPMITILIFHQVFLRPDQEGYLAAVARSIESELLPKFEGTSQ